VRRFQEIKVVGRKKKTGTAAKSNSELQICPALVHRTLPNIAAYQPSKKEGSKTDHCSDIVSSNSVVPSFFE
jgi:hypothetical protein